LLDTEEVSWNRSITLPPREQRGMDVLQSVSLHEQMGYWLQGVHHLVNSRSL